jgi:cytochrome P450
LSFSNSKSWKDIYGFRPDHKTFVKSEFYDGGSFADQASSIVSERDPTEHGRMRKYLSHAFSDRSLMEQEEIISSVIDRFIIKVGETGTRPEGTNFSKRLEMMTFDIIGDLAFGETFGGVESGK